MIQMYDTHVLSFTHIVFNIVFFFQHIVSIIEFIIPMALSLVLSIIHSQIVATASIKNESGNKRNPFLHSKKKKRERIRRKRKLNK